MMDSGVARDAARNYLKVPPSAPWRWTENAKVIAWNDDTTIIFREELIELLDALAGDGLPPFPEMVLLFAALRGKTVQSPAVEPASTSRDSLLAALHGQIERKTSTSILRLSSLPPQLTSTTRGKTNLVHLVFENRPRLSIALSHEVAHGSKLALAEHDLNTAALGAPTSDAAAILARIAATLEPYDANTLRIRVETGVDAPPKPASEVELPPHEKIKRLLADLALTDEHSGLAVVARDLIAALRLPQIVAQNEELSSEGAADIGNRGSLDQLLVSELAHDDTTLATRVALNEALYIRREPPATRPERALALLVDSGIRMWGVPRLLALASALAFLSKHRSARTALFFRTHRDSALLSDLSSQRAIEEHLAVLGTEYNPGAAIRDFWKKLEEPATTDVIVILNRDSLRDPVVRHSLDLIDSGRKFILLIDRAGTIELYSGSPTGRALLRTEIALTKLIGGAPGKKRAPNTAQEFPAIFKEAVCPLLLPIHTPIEKVIRLDELLVSVTKDLRLMTWSANGFAATERVRRLLGENVVWLGAVGSDAIVVTTSAESVHLISVGVRNTAPARDHTLRKNSLPLWVFLEQQIVILIFPTHVVAADPVAGRVVCELELPQGMRWISQRYFLKDGKLFFAFWGGSAVRWDEALTNKSNVASIALAFEREGTGAFLVLKDGRVLGPSGNEIATFSFPFTAVSAHRRGNLLAFTDGNSNIRKGTAKVLDLSGKSTRAQLVNTLLDVDLSGCAPPNRNLQNRFAVIQALPGQCLRLKTSNNKWLQLSWCESLLRLTEIPTTEVDLSVECPRFEEVKTPQAYGTSLKVAKWSAGSRAWLDGRGLLHLQARDESIPQLTLTLSHFGGVAGWATDGTRGGAAFFHGKDHSMDRVLTILGRFTDQVC